MSNCPRSIAAAIVLAAQAASAQMVLIDFDDGIPDNGEHDASIRNGGFEDGDADTGNVADIAPWVSYFDTINRSGEGAAAQWWFPSGGVDDSEHTVISGWLNGGTGLPRRHLMQVIPAELWTIEEGDTFLLSFDAREAEDLDDDDEIEVEFRAFDGGSYALITEDRPQLPDDGSWARAQIAFTLEGAGHVGRQLSFRLLASGSAAGRDEFVAIDNVTLIATRAGTGAEPATLLAHYPAEGTTTDTSGNGRDGSASAGLAYGAGFGIGRCFLGNGTDASVAIPHDAPNSFSIAFWMRAHTSGSSGTTLAWWQGDGLIDGDVPGAGGDFGVSLFGDRIAFGAESVAAKTLFSQSRVTDGAWHHVAATRSTLTGRMQLFVDGVLEAEDFGPAGMLSGPTSIAIAAAPSDRRHFAGCIDELSVFSGILTTEEIAILHLGEGTSDTDGDGFDNGTESMAGTVWGDANDYPRLEIAAPGGVNVELSVDGRRGRVYRLSESNDLANWSELAVTDSLAADGRTVLASPPASGEKFYRASIEPGSTSKPNIIVLVIDDLGFADIGAFPGSAADVLTPNLDRIASAGTRCTSAYVTGPVCSPSRSGWLTGRHQSEWDKSSSWNPGLPSSVPTLAQMLGGDGYATCKIGKNDFGTNLGNATNFSPHGYPGNHGFDRFLGFTAHAHDFWFHRAGGNNVGGGSSHAGPLQNHDFLLAPGSSPTTTPFTGVDDPDNTTDEPDYYLTKLLTDQAMDFVGRQAVADQPFFLALSFNAVHHLTPEVPQEDLDQIGAHLGEPVPPEIEHYDPTTNTPSNPSNYSNFYQYWNKVANVGNTEMRKYYLANLLALDANIGRLYDQLQTLGLAEDTLLFIFSDNGGPPETGANNGALMGSKYNLFEGGIRVPMIVSWPGRVPAGNTYDEIVSVLDVVPTCLDATSARTRPNLRGHSLLEPLADGSPVVDERTLFWKWKSSNWAIRRGDWKLVHSGVNRSGNFTDQVYFDNAITGKLSLFNLADSPAEIAANDRIDDPEVAAIRADLEAIWNAWHDDL